LEILGKTDNFQKIYFQIFFVLVFRDGSLEVPHAEATSYNKNLFRMFA